MFISQELRRKNIAEYLLYMWQVEDIIRAYGCSLSRIRHEYIDKFDYTEEQKEEMADWYGNLVRMMNQEGCREKGHLQINKIVMQQLVELNAQLLQSTKYPFITANITRFCLSSSSYASVGWIMRKMKWRHVSTPFME